MKKLIQWFCGYVCIQLNGRQINRFLNLCARNGIQIWNVTTDMERAARAHLHLKDIYLIRPFLRKTKTHFHIIKKKGFPFWCHRHKRLKWMFVLLFALALLYLNSLNYVWNIRILGNSNISTAEILDVIQADELIGTRRKNINCTDIEYQLRKEYNQMGWVSVFVDHTDLCIYVRESLYEEYVFEEEDAIQRYDYITEKDAIIHSIITRSGTALVKKGDHVRAGDVLVSGFYDVFDDNGEIKATLPVKADALIFGDVVYEHHTMLTEMELLGAKIGGGEIEHAIKSLSYLRFNQFIEKLEKNGVKILAKRVMIEQTEHYVLIKGSVAAREEIGTNIPVEEKMINESE
uniref:sporulation protein YqfD n=1 Tax=Agathobacter sp. TaxID=2021311 RepID=UPI004057B87F